MLLVSESCVSDTKHSTSPLSNCFLCSTKSGWLNCKLLRTAGKTSTCWNIAKASLPFFIPRFLFLQPVYLPVQWKIQRLINSGRKWSYASQKELWFHLNKDWRDKKIVLICNLNSPTVLWFKLPCGFSIKINNLLN